MAFNRYFVAAVWQIIFVLMPFCTYAFPHFGFRSITGDEGLSASYVKHIAQDSNGFIWIATKNGLDRYDGVSVKTFSCWDDVAQRGNNNIGAVYEDDQRNLWIGTDRGVYIFDPKKETFNLLNRSSSSGVSADDWVQTIQGDENGNIWILIPNQGVFRYDGEKIDYYSVTNHNGDKEKLPVSLLVDNEGGIFVGTKRDGLFFYDSQNNSFRNLSGKYPALRKLEEMNIQFLAEMGNGNLYIGSNQGKLYSLDKKNYNLESVNLDIDNEIYIHDLKCVGKEIWFGTSQGIFCYYPGDSSILEISKNTMGHHSLSDNIITSLFEDRDGNIWAGSMFGGMNFIQRKGLVFERYTEDFSERGISSSHVRGMAIDSKGMIWIGTEGSGINLLDPRSGKIQKLKSENPDNMITLCLESLGDKVYAGFARGGCAVYQNGVFQETIAHNNMASVSDVYSIMEDREGNIWLGASWGLFKRKKGETNFENIEDIGYGWVYDMMQDSRGMIWIASMGDGIWAYHPAKNIFTHYPFDETHANGLKSNSISSIFEDSKGRIWFSTDRGGLVRYNPDKDNFETFGIENGFPDDTVYGVIEDNKGYLWFGTNRGLVKFNPDTEEVRIYSKGFGQFNYNSAVKDKQGRIYMGGVEGLLTFNPEDEDDSYDPRVFFTDFKITGNSTSGGRTNGIVYSDNIKLEPNENSFSVSLGYPHYSSYNNVEFVYRLLPSNKEWSTVKDPSNLSFAELSSGNYTLEVKISGAPDDTACRIAINIKTPWYESWWAFCIYGVLLGVLVVLLAIYYRKRQLKKLNEKEDKFTIEKEKELYKKKLKFFTEIAHEIRTPLTLIGTPLEAIEEIGVKEPRINKYLKVIRQNTSRLLDLTGQILDFQKMESEAPPLKFEIVDIRSLVQETIDRFEMTIANRNKSLICHLPSGKILANVDKDAVIKILSNLFNNAMKYSDRHIEISLNALEDTFEVTVTSDGEKIQGENRYKIFEPFYQSSKKTDNGGVGIGLPLCRTLAYLHGGMIDLVEDDKPNSNTFKLSLPLNVDIENPELKNDPVITEYVMEEDSPMKTNNNGYSLLFVDDNDEMREFLDDQLSKDFVVETASNGEEALAKLHEGRYDIIVTDIMMPVMDGYELCRHIKEDPNLSPIPVVFLTAKNDLESKVRALECGGESYIEKPFSIKYFRQQIKSLLDNRRHERKAFLNKPFFTVDNMKMNKADEEFMNKVIEIINKNIENENFNVESLADIFCMSRSSLLRKIKTLFNLSPVELIRIVRLKKAAELIQDGKYRMGDICYMVGINSQSYFTRLFLKQFGITPKTFEKQCREKQQGQSKPDISDDLDIKL